MATHMANESVVREKKNINEAERKFNYRCDSNLLSLFVSFTSKDCGFFLHFTPSQILPIQNFNNRSNHEIEIFVPF